MKGDTHLVPGEHKASDDFCEAPPREIPPEDVPEFKTDSDLVAIKMVALSRDIMKTERLTYEEAKDFVVDAMGELMNKVSQ